MGTSLNDLSTWERTYLAPAKLNEFLHIIERQPDGYHRLQTAFRLIGLYDTLRFTSRDDGDIRLVSAPPGITAENDLATRAARLLKPYASHLCGVDIDIQKAIPLGSGLGGGSSNAATTLMVLNQLWNIHLSASELQALGRQIGADVPFFIFGRDAFAEGIGDIFYPLEWPESWYVLLFPPVNVSTALIFSHPDLKRSAPSIPAEKYEMGMGENVLTPIATSLFPVVGDYLEWLGHFGPAKMSGSGSTVFLACEDETTAQKIYAKRPSGYKGVIVPSLDRHPLYKMTDAK